MQTQTDGRARIQLADGSTLVVRPDSVVTIRDNARAEDGGRTQVRVAVERGQINVRTEQQTEGSRNVVETPLTKNNLGSKTGASFGVREDNTEEVRVDAGRIETVTRGGEKTVVTGGEYVALNQSGAVKNRERLLDIPLPISPRDLEKLAAGIKVTADVLLRGSGPRREPRATTASRSHVALLRAAGKVTERDQLETTNFTSSELQRASSSGACAPSRRRARRATGASRRSSRSRRPRRAAATAARLTVSTSRSTWSPATSTSRAGARSPATSSASRAARRPRRATALRGTA